MTEALRRWRIIPVIVIDEPKNAVPLATALLAGGLPIAEITLRTPAALESLRRITQEQPEMFAGVGTVLNVRQAEQARKAGAHFVISPGLNRAVVDYCLEHDVPVYPGVATASEIEAAIEAGLTLLKLWPIETLGGIPYLQAPFGTIRWRRVQSQRRRHGRKLRELPRAQERRRVRRVVDGAGGLDRGEAVRAHQRRRAGHRDEGREIRSPQEAAGRISFGGSEAGGRAISDPGPRN